ncbi:MAG: outer membrane beta-barrel protein [Ferruginibacter sp.]
MIKLFLVFFFTNMILLTGIAQTSSISGDLIDKLDKKAVAGATVGLLLQADSSIVKTIVSDNTGHFIFDNVANDSFIVQINTLNYQEYISFININNNQKNLGVLSLERQGKDLSTVTIVAKVAPVTQKGDTAQFSASQYKVNPDATTEDLIKKMPGITVDKTGTVTAQGETVKKVTIDGKDFFGDDASAALKNLPSEVVDKIQVYDRLSDQAQLTGFDDGNSVKAINIVTKSQIKNGQFGRAFAGIGTDNRYSAGGNISFFNGNRRTSIVANLNNINQQNFGSQDLLGVTTGSGIGAGGDRGGRGGRGGGGGGTENFTVGQASGISKTNALGINYSDKWGQKATVTGSYFFNNSTNNNESLINTQTLLANGKNLFTTQNSNTETVNNNHRINLRVEYKIDSSNSIFIIPSINFQNNSAASLSSYKSYYGAGDTTNTSLNKSIADRTGFNIRNNILFRHSFAKRGRTLSFGFNTTYTKNDGTGINDGQYRFFNNRAVTDSTQNQYADNTTNGYSISGNIAYTEPVGKKGQFQINYSPSVQKNKADQQTFLYDGQKYTTFDTTLSNKFDNTITTNNAGITYRLTPGKDEQFAVGINFQNSKLESQRIFPSKSAVSQSFSDILPNLMWRKKFSATSSIRLFYRASTNFPTVNQLQDVVNLSNPLRISSGNPDLKQSATNFVAGRYTYTNSKTGKSFFANLFLQAASNYISNAIYIASADSTIQQNIVLKQNSQLTKPVNLNGYKSLSTFFTYSIPVKALKTTINLNAGFNYAKLPGQVNYVNTTTDNYVYNTGVVFASNISQYIDFNISYNAAFNNAQTTASNASNNKYVNQAAGFQLNLLDKKGWFVKNDISNQSYSGLSAGLNQSFWLWNAAIGKKILKNQAGELKLSVFDLLKQNQSIVRTVTGADIVDSQSKVLQQYFMLTFTYNLKNFGVAKPTGKNTEEGHGPIRGNTPGF